jgi:hypothetical protein
MAIEMATKCESCFGTGEMPGDYGIADCPDCGGGGILPPPGVRVEWRAADVLRAADGGQTVDPEHARWLVAELRRARVALTEIIALAHDAPPDDSIALRIRFAANRALRLYEFRRADDPGSQ